MILTLETPVKLRLTNIEDAELIGLQGMLRYRDNEIEQKMRELQKNFYYTQRYGEAWVNSRLDELKLELWKTLLFEDDSGYYTLPGLLSRIQKQFPLASFKNNVFYPEFELFPWKKKPDLTPLPYQTASIEAFLMNFHSHVEIATGLGKTLISILMVKETGLPTIISTPSIGLAKSLFKELKIFFGTKDVGMFGGGRRDIGKKILVCVGKSLSMVEGEEIEDFKKYQVFISDESHTLPAKGFSYFCNTVLGHCPYRWFLSATQERNDGKDLMLEGIIGPEVYSKSIQEGIDEGYLAKLSTLIFDVDSGSNYSSARAVGMNQHHLYKNETILQIISAMVPDAINKGMPVIILVDEHEQERLLRNRLGNIFTYARGGTDTEKICADFNAGKIMCVVGTSAVSTGTNFKPVQLTINWKGNKAGTKVKQGAIGRSTRLDPASGKDSCRIVDFRVVNIPMLYRHANERIKFYKQVGPVHFAKVNV